MPRTQSTKKAPAPDKAQIVLRAARNVFLSHGFSAATTDMIQQEAGVSKSTVYAHYPNKETLFTAVIEAECTALTSTVRSVEFRPGKLKEVLALLARAYLEIVLSPTGLAVFRVVIAEGLRFPKLARAFYRAGPQVMTTTVAKQLANAQASGEIDLGEFTPELAANLFINLVRGELQLHCLTHSDATPSSAQIDQWVGAVVATFMRAYGGQLPVTPIFPISCHEGIEPVEAYSHSIVAGGLLLTSYVTRLIPRTSLMMRVDTRLSSA